MLRVRVERIVSDTITVIMHLRWHHSFVGTYVFRVAIHFVSRYGLSRKIALLHSVRMQIASRIQTFSFHNTSTFDEQQIALNVYCPAYFGNWKASIYIST